MSDSEAELEVGEIIGERSSARKGLEYLVRWKTFGPEQDSWEPLKNLSNAVQAIADFHKKAFTTQQKKSKKTTRKSKSKSRSRSRSRSSSRTRGKKSASPARKSTRTTTTTTKTVKTPTVEETKTEVVSNSPGIFEKTETVTKSVNSPKIEQSTHVSRVSEFRSSTANSQSSSQAQEKSCSWMNICCAPVRKVQDCFRGCMRSDYPAIIVMGTISIIVLSFLLERNVDFEKVWSSITAFFIGIWTWLTTLVSTK